MKRSNPVVIMGAAVAAAVLGLAASRPTQERAEEGPFFGASTYERWLKQEGLPVYRGGVVDDLSKVEVKPWKRMGPGILGAYIFLEGTGGTVDAFVMEIPRGARTVPEKHVFEEQLLILQGKGETTVWQRNPKEKVTVSWGRGAMFPAPLNAWHQHVNLGDQPVRLIGITNSPLLMDMYRNLDFIFKNDFAFSDRFRGQTTYFSPEPSRLFPKEGRRHHYSIVHFVPDVWNCNLYPAGQGVDDRDQHFGLGYNSMAAHVEQFPVGTYQRAHRHGPGSTIILLNGSGYTLMWPPDLGTTPYKDGKAEKVVRVDWKEGTLVVPPLQWYHQHFNSGPVPARFVKLGGWNNDLYPFTTDVISDPNRTEIDYKDEDPRVRQLFAEELQKKGAPMKMPDVAHLDLDPLVRERIQQLSR
ncbi:MAG: cupin domain-containing protein [Acidobacteria bacterium]|nr:cupin domain-containing protein [Acidobacteriota bacterium]